jgi:hypothetical protein
MGRGVTNLDDIEQKWLKRRARWEMAEEAWGLVLALTAIVLSVVGFFVDAVLYHDAYELVRAVVE